MLRCVNSWRSTAWGWFPNHPVVPRCRSPTRSAGVISVYVYIRYLVAAIPSRVVGVMGRSVEIDGLVEMSMDV